MKANEHSELLNAAIKCLSYRPYSGHELKQKLVKKGYVPEEVDDVIDKLTAEKLINDAEYARSILRHNLHKGNSAIKRKFTDKGISKELFQPVLDDSQPEIERARLAAEKKWPKIRKEDSRKRMESLGRFLASRGFSPKSVYTILSEYKTGSEESGEC